MAFKDYFYFDIETTSKSQSLFDLKLNDEKGYELFAEKCAKMQKYEQDWVGKIDEIYTEKAPLIPEFGKIICMSFGMFTENGKKIMTVVDDDEEVLIRRIFKLLNRAGNSKRSLCGYNIKNFDIPFLIKKMYKYDIDIPLVINFNGVKPWEILIKDLYDIWKGIGKTGSSLEEVAYELEIDYQKIVSGKDIHERYWGKKDISSIIKKCEIDVDVSIKIAEKLKL